MTRPEPCVDWQTCGTCRGVGRDENANFYCHFCNGEGSVRAHRFHYEVRSPVVTTYSYGEPPDDGICWGVYLAPSARRARVMAVQDDEFKMWVREVRGDSPPMKGLTARLFRCDHDVCWECGGEEGCDYPCEDCRKEDEARMRAEELEVAG